ncbi:hypothetical protein VNO78_06967 [Psophocarpus tetragonolobus]|uniref:Disease resistance N-terminal domain-containing protein n=1 Tax=Psophocarpus tetragonolobus TaxID=3891 RepID=A0AAN9T2L5_PSOTE
MSMTQCRFNILTKRMRFLNALAEDAKQKQFSHSYWKAGLDEVKYVVFNTEDLLDEIDKHFSKLELNPTQLLTKYVSNFDMKFE